MQPDRYASADPSYLHAVLLWMCIGLLASAVAAGWVVLSAAMQDLASSPGTFLVLLLAEVIVVFFIHANLDRTPPAAAAVFFLFYSVLHGLTFGGLVSAYSGVEIFQAFLVAAVMFGVTGVHGWLTRSDRTLRGSLFAMALTGVVTATLFSLYAPQPALTFAVNAGVIVVFLGLSAWDARMIDELATQRAAPAERSAVVGALILYLDFINIVLMFLHLTERRKQPEKR